LHMSQIFSLYPHIRHLVVLLFEDSVSGTPGGAGCPYPL
jgi:hypothetical protein